MSESIILFSHFGYSSYLEYSLKCARKTNPEARLILLGDEHNADVAKRNDWEHYLFRDYSSKSHTRFDQSFKHVQGKKHNHVKNDVDWLRYVFERWFFIDGFLRCEKIDRFWHFDSDTMILKNLHTFDASLMGYDYSVQCNGTCLNGIVSRDVVTEFCEHICHLFEDDDFLSAQQQEFDSVSPGYAFTEMRAFSNYMSTSSRLGLHLLAYSTDQVFDDCICQSHGFEMTQLPSGQSVKALFSRNGKIFSIRNRNEIEFISLNLSWVPVYAFKWTLDALNGSNSKIENADCPVKERMKGYLRKMKKFTF